jgi:hypothetical protein
MNFASLIAAILLISNFGLAKEMDGYTKDTPCAKANVISGDTCSNVKVEFNFKECSVPFDTSLADRITCEGQTITARITRNEYRFQAKYKKEDSGWSGVQWLPIGQVLTWTKISPKVTEPKPSPVKEQVTTPTPLATAVSTLPSLLKISSFIDVRYTTYTSDNTTINEDENSGYLFEDGALYLGYKDGALGINIDLPFSRNADASTNSADIAFAKSKAQFYAKYDFTPELSVTFGQFDTIFGFELNDSKDRVFGYAGLVYGQTLPVVHSGVFLQYTKESFTAKLLSANPSDRDALGTDSTDSSHEFGATLNFTNELFRSQIGYLSRSKENLAGGSATRSLIDILVGTTLGIFALDLEYSIVDDPSKNTLTTDSTDEEDAGSGFMLHVAIQTSDQLRLGVRYELITDDPAATGYQDVEGYGLNLQYQVHPNLAVRSEYNQINSTKKSASDVDDESRVSVGALLSF